MGDYSKGHSKRLAQKYLADRDAGLIDGEPPAKVKQVDLAESLDVEDDGGDGSADSAKDQQEDPLLHDERELVTLNENDNSSDLIVKEDQLLPDTEEPNVLKDLREWAIQCNVKRCQLTTLLKTLNKHYGDMYPTDVLTLMKTEDTVDSINTLSDDAR